MEVTLTTDEKNEKINFLQESLDAMQKVVNNFFVRVSFSLMIFMILIKLNLLKQVMRINSWLNLNRTFLL